MQAELLLGMWNLPGSSIKPMSPALAGRFIFFIFFFSFFFFVVNFVIH